MRQLAVMAPGPYFSHVFQGPGMILTCSSCGTRYSVDGSKFPAAGRTVRCAKCGHSWHQAAEAAPEPEPEAQMASVAVEPDVVSPQREAERDEPFPEGDTSATRMFGNPPAVEAPRAPIGPLLAVVAGWAGLIVLVLSIAFLAVRYRQDIAVAWPQSAGVYSSLGLSVNTSGIDFRQVDYRRESEDGQVVLAVTGQIVNAGSRQLPVPQTVRVTLSDASNHELYHWTFKPSASVLAPGQSVSFTTRLSSPPAAARHLEVRFAKDGT
jgi:predicted Zn finger-like uncharacterized protein